ncbi:MAG: lipopolysaccharide heptosyltransferase I [Vicinamibacterales bacterium]
MAETTGGATRIDRLLIVRLGSLGDLIHTLPAVAALRRAHPSAEIDWLVDAVHADLLGLVPILTRVITLGRRSAGGWLSARRELRRRRYDLALDFQGLIKSAALARFSGARRVLGFDREALREPAARVFYTSAVPVGESGHVLHKNLRLAAAAGAATDRVEFPIVVEASAAREAIRAMLAAAAPDAATGDDRAARYALINPGAAWPNKCWPPARYGQVARHVKAVHGLTPVVLWGPGEVARARAVADASDGAAVVAPPTALADLVALARDAALMVSGDTGPMHIAGAMGVPLVALFGPTSPARNGPWDPRDVSITRYDACDCHYVRRCRRPDADWCLASIAVGEVVHAIDRRLPAGRAGAGPGPAGMNVDSHADPRNPGAPA